MPVKPLEPLERSGSRPQNSRSIRTHGIQKLPDITGQARSASRLSVVDANSGQSGERWIKHRFAVPGFASVKVFESLGDCQLKCVVIREVALNNNLPRLVTST